MGVCVLHLLPDTPSAIPFFPRAPHASARVQVLLAAVALLFALAAEMPAAFLACTLVEGEPFFCVVARRLQDLAPRERSRNSMRITAGAHVACALQFRFACHRVR